MGSKLLLVLVYLCFQQVLGFYINDTRVHYGKPYNIEQIPYQVALLYNQQPHCGGSILTKQHILSAGHCFYRRDIRSMKFRLGSNGPGDARSIFMNIKQAFIHPQYQHGPMYNDVAVAVLSSFINFNQRMQPIKLPNRQPDLGARVLASGWGETEMAPQQPSRTLMGVETRIASSSECRHHVPHPTYFCTTYSKHGVCHGDSGGPLVDLARREVVGISSFVDPACRGNPGPYASFFANVYVLRSFIDKILQQHKNSTEN